MSFVFFFLVPVSEKVMSAFTMTGLTDEDLSAMSGRICAPGVPPKSKAEAREHIQQIRKLMEHERLMAAEEAKQNRQRRETAELCTQHWLHTVFTNPDKELRSKRTTELWTKHGIPAPLRGTAWPLIVGNAHNITHKMYDVCVRKAEVREQRHASQRSAEQHSTSSHPASHRRHAAEHQQRREEDPTFFSPKMSKLESMMQINVDLPRTIISRTVVSHSPSASSDASSGGGSPYNSPLQSPRGRLSFTDSNGPHVAPPPSSQADGSAAYSTTVGGLSTSTMLISSMCDDVLLARVRRALCAYVEYRPDIGYVQGMSYLAAMILMHTNDDHVGFVMLANMLSTHHFRYFYSVHHQGMGVYLAAYDEVLKHSLPELYKNFAMIGVHPQMYVIDWWMSLFSRALPYEIAARCWDFFFLDEVYLFRLSIAILVYFSPYIHEESALDEVMVFLSKVQRQFVDERRFFAIVEDDAQCGSSLEAMRKILDARLANVPGGSDGESLEL